MKYWINMVLLSLAIVITGCAGKEESHANDTVPVVKQQLQSILDTSIEETRTAGAVLLVQTPSFHWVGASGFADTAGKTLMKPDDKLRLASMTKTFVSVVILKLQEEGKLNLNDKIEAHLPAAIIGEITHGSEITIRQLLSMTSGIRGYTESDSYNDAVETNPYRKPWTAEEILTYSYSKEALFSPGDGWDYSNTNYVLLDLIVKHSCKTSLAVEIRRLILAPLRLRNTFMEIQEPGKEGFGGLVVRGYDNGEDVTEIQDALGLGDGGLISDATDVAKFFTALFGDKSILNETSLGQMRDFHKTEDYGLGLERRMTNYGEAWGHSGGSWGFEGDMLFLPDKEVVIVILTNTEDTDVLEMVFHRITEQLIKDSVF